MRLKIESLEAELAEQERSYEGFIEEQKEYDTLDNDGMVERMLGIERIRKEILELKSWHRA